MSDLEDSPVSQLEGFREALRGIMPETNRTFLQVPSDTRKQFANRQAHFLVGFTRTHRKGELWVSKEKFWAAYGLYLTEDVSMADLFRFVHSMNAVGSLVSCCFPLVPHSPP